MMPVRREKMEWPIGVLGGARRREPGSGGVGDQVDPVASMRVSVACPNPASRETTVQQVQKGALEQRVNGQNLPQIAAVEEVNQIP